MVAGVPMAGFLAALRQRLRGDAALARALQARCAFLGDAPFTEEDWEDLENWGDWREIPPMPPRPEPMVRAPPPAPPPEDDDDDVFLDALDGS